MQDVLQVIERALTVMRGKGTVLTTLGVSAEGYEAMITMGATVKRHYYEREGGKDDVIDVATLRIGTYPNAVELTVSRPSRPPTAAERVEFYASSSRHPDAIDFKTAATLSEGKAA